MELWARNGRTNFAESGDFHVTFGVLLHAVILRHGTDRFTSPPKEGSLRIFSPEKSDGFGRVWTRELGYQRPARYLQTTEAGFCRLYSDYKFDYVKILFILLFICLQFKLFIEIFSFSSVCMLWPSYQIFLPNSAHLSVIPHAIHILCPSPPSFHYCEDYYRPWRPSLCCSVLPPPLTPLATMSQVIYTFDCRIDFTVKVRHHKTAVGLLEPQGGRTNLSSIQTLYIFITQTAHQLWYNARVKCKKAENIDRNWRKFAGVRNWKVELIRARKFLENVNDDLIRDLLRRA